MRISLGRYGKVVYANGAGRKGVEFRVTDSDCIVEVIGKPEKRRLIGLLWKGGKWRTNNVEVSRLMGSIVTGKTGQGSVHIVYQRGDRNAGKAYRGVRK